MSRMPTAAWVTVAVLGLMLAGGAGVGVSKLVDQEVGLSEEPISAGEQLAPASTTSDVADRAAARRARARRAKVRRVARARRRAAARRPAAGTPAVPTPAPQPAQPAAPPATGDSDDGLVEPPEPDDDNSGSGGGGDDSSGKGRGRGRGGDDD